ncbi:MAG TPA: hypothetical protein VIG45_06795 [Erysipelothrix sp.]
MKTEYEKVLLPKSVQQELEKLRAQAISDACEIARLQSGFDELSDKCWLLLKNDENSSEFGDALIWMMKEINRITGVWK